MGERWIAVDWGTSNLRAWLVESDRAIAEATSSDGMGGLAAAQFEPALVSLVAPWLAEDVTTEVVACGMVGARQGWHEAPYAPVPAAPLDATRFVVAPTSDPRITVTIVHGLCQPPPAADVMRGEETQLAGLLAREPRFEGLACLPGTHSKWAHLSDSRVEGFATFMTGELFALLERQSVLRHVVGPGDDGEAFDGGVRDGLDDPAGLTGRLFGVRAEALLQGLPPAAGRERLSGLLIGTEIAAAQARFGRRRVTVVGAGALAARYARALSMAGVAAGTLDGGALVLAGLIAARHALETTR